jgi:hypothetical protein
VPVEWSAESAALVVKGFGCHRLRRIWPCLGLLLPLWLPAACGGGGGGIGSGGSNGSSGGGGANVIVTVSPGVTAAISPYIYGINSDAGNGSPVGITFDRAGGNRWTAYNWEINASNAGSDYLYENDDYLSSSSTPAQPVTSFIATDQASGLASLITFQLQGSVAADENASLPMDMSNPPISDASRFDKVVYQKSTQSSVPFTTSPDLTDGYVYMDEFIWALNQKFPGQNIFGANPASQPVFAQLDNEPDLWNMTHKEVQGPTEITPSAFIAKSIGLAEALKAQFPDLVVFGPVNYGFEGIFDWQGALTATPAGNNWFADQYLAAMKAASASFGAPLVDVYDFHWYSQVSDGNGGMITDLNGASLTDAQVQSIVQSPRSLWDTTYTENSWITSDVLGGANLHAGPPAVAHRGGKSGHENIHHRIQQWRGGEYCRHDRRGRRSRHLRRPRIVCGEPLAAHQHRALYPRRFSRVPRFRRCELKFWRCVRADGIEQCGGRRGIREHRQHSAGAGGLRRDQPLDVESGHRDQRRTSGRGRAPLSDDRELGRRSKQRPAGCGGYPSRFRHLVDGHASGAQRHDDRHLLIRDRYP